MSLTRTQILNGDYLFPSELVRLRQTNHFVERLEERGIEMDCIPSLVRVTKDNIYSGEVSGKEFISVVVRLKYSHIRYMFLCFNPNDGVLKTVWFTEKRGGYGNRERQDPDKDSGQAVRDIGS